MKKLPTITKKEWKEAKTNHDKAVELYLRGKTENETDEQRMRRIQRFRCGG